MRSKRPLRLTHLEVRGFRNLTKADLSLGPGFNVVSGDNGQGKTNLIEAIYLLCTSRSFRTKVPGELLGHGCDAAAVTGTFREADEELPGTQSVGIAANTRRLTRDGKLVRAMAAYAERRPVVVFEPRSLELTQGGASERRRLLDRVGFHLAVRSEGTASGATEDLTRYQQANARRRRALARGDDPRVLDALEELLSRHGSRIAARRRQTLERLAPRVLATFAEVARAPLPLAISYVHRGPTDDSGLRSALQASRAEDARRGTTTVGPHLDDLAILLDARSFRAVASQGQHRLLVLAMVSAEIETIEDARGVSPILLLDDVSSELDRSRNSTWFRFLDGWGGQVVVTTTRPEAIETDTNRRDFVVSGGRVTGAKDG